MQNNVTKKLTTEEVAKLARVQPQSIRAAVCRKGDWLGLRPIKLPNRLLLWDSDQVVKVLNGEVSK